MSTGNIRDDAGTLLRLYTAMVRIRFFEERLAEIVKEGEVRTPCHLYIGQEAIAAGVCTAAEKSDYVWGNHRSHGHYLAKGGEMRSMMAEIFGKATGCSEGRGGSMHLVATEVGILGTVPLVAATIPLAVGAGLASKLKTDGRVSISFFGDGATEEGHFHESLNLAALYQLPVLFVCENNFYASHMALLERRRKDNILVAGDAHGLPGASVDGNNAMQVFETAKNAMDAARAGNGPFLLECRTYRWRGHVGPSWDMDVGVKRKDELEDWLERDPITSCRAALQRSGMPDSELLRIDEEAHAEVEDSVIFARTSPYPTSDQVGKHIFADNDR